MTRVFERQCVSATPPSATTAPEGDRKEVKMTDNFTLESFSQNPFYQEVNRRLVALARLRPGQRVVDLGAGTGAVTRLLVEEVGGNGGAGAGVASQAHQKAGGRRFLLQRDPPGEGEGGRYAGGVPQPEGGRYVLL